MKATPLFRVNKNPKKKTNSVIYLVSFFSFSQMNNAKVSALLCAVLGIARVCTKSFSFFFDKFVLEK
jgi:hypothetical protein